MAKVPNTVEILPKISTAWVGRTNVTDDRQTTDVRAIAYSEQFTFANKVNCLDWYTAHVWQVGRCSRPSIKRGRHILQYIHVHWTDINGINVYIDCHTHRSLPLSSPLKSSKGRPEEASIRLVSIGATWRIRLNRPYAATTRSYVKLLWPLVKILNMSVFVWCLRRCDRHARWFTLCRRYGATVIQVIVEKQTSQQRWLAQSGLTYTHTPIVSQQRPALQSSTLSTILIINLLQCNLTRAQFYTAVWNPWLLNTRRISHFSVVTFLHYLRIH